MKFQVIIFWAFFLVVLFSGFNMVVDEGYQMLNILKMAGRTVKRTKT